MNIREYIKDQLLYLDGGMGTLLQAAGMKAGELPERRNLTNPDDIVAIHRAYFDAGSNVVNTNTFGANILKYSEEELEQIIPTAIALARKAADESRGTQEKFIALDVGPLGRLIKPYGDLEFEDAVEIFAKTVRIGSACGVDLIMIETMSDSLETKAALLAAKQSCELPIFVSNAYGADGRLMTGTDPAAMIAMLEGLGADVIGINCSLGPKQMIPVVEKYLAYASVPVLVKPNAGLPRCEGDKTYYDVAPDEFAAVMQDFVVQGARVVGGCCGTTPAYIAALHGATSNMQSLSTVDKARTVISSYHHAVVLGEQPISVGRSTDALRNTAVKAALADNDLDSVVDEAFEDTAEGAQVLKVCVAVEGIDQDALLSGTVKELQAVINLPMWLQSSSPCALSRALRAYNGRAMVSPMEETPEALEAIIPVVEEYGAVLALNSDTLCDLAVQAYHIKAKDVLRIHDDTVSYVS